MPALRSQGWSFLTENEWLPEADKFGIASLLWGTVLIGVFALVVAVPVALGAALFISEYAPRSLKKPLITLVDLMAAVPAIIYAIWALFFLQEHLLTVAEWLSVHLGTWLPFLTVQRAGLAVVVHLLGVHRRHRRRCGRAADDDLGDARGVLAGADR